VQNLPVLSNLFQQLGEFLKEKNFQSKKKSKNVLEKTHFLSKTGLKKWLFDF